MENIKNKIDKLKQLIMERNLDIEIIIRDSMLEYDSFLEKISGYVKRGLENKVRNGDFPSKAPVGYINNKLTKKIEIDTEKVNLVKNIFNDILNNVSLYKIIKNDKYARLNLNKRKLISMLTNKFYTGNFTYNKIEYKGNHDPIITKDQYKIIRRKLLKQNKKYDKRKK